MVITNSNEERVTKIDTYLNAAEVFAYRSTCLKRKYGAVIVRDDAVISTGYNGAPRGNGYGKQLLDTVIKKAREEGFRYIVLDSMSKYKAALGLYESLGFVTIDKYNDNDYADIFMRLEL